jgi:Zn-dependent protease
MVAFRIDRGGVVVVGAVVLIGIGAMAGDIGAGLLLGTLTAVSLLLHECGHMLAARALGVKVREIGVCLKGPYVRRMQARAPIEEATIALSGPMVNAMIAAVLWSVSGVGHWLAIYNLVLLTSNLAPLPGSDGRRILTAWTRAAADALLPIAIPKTK